MKINGETLSPDGRTVEQIIESMGFKGNMVAVELNEEILSRDQYSSYVPGEKDIIEIVQFMGGGC